MSDSLLFQVFYGPGEIRYGFEGVQLLKFKSFTKQVSRARERNWCSVCNWLYKAFDLDKEQHELLVMAVVTFRMDKIFWTLIPLEGTQNWREYVNIATERGLPLVLFVQVFYKIGSSSQIQEKGTEITDGPTEEDIQHGVEETEEGDDPPHEPTSKADKREHIPHEATREAPKATDTYPVARDQNFSIASEVIAAIEAEASHNMENYMYMAPYEHELAYKRIKEYCARFQQAMSCGDHVDVHLPPRPMYFSSSSTPSTRPAYHGWSSATPTHAAYPGLSSGPSVRPQWTAPCPTGTQFSAQHLGVGLSSRGLRVDDLDRVHKSWRDRERRSGEHRKDDAMGQLPFQHQATNPYPEEIGASQLGGTPLASTQVSQEAFTTPVADEAGRPTEHHTYLQPHTKTTQVVDRQARKVAESAPRYKRGRI